MRTNIWSLQWPPNIPKPGTTKRWFWFFFLAHVFLALYYDLRDLFREARLFVFLVFIESTMDHKYIDILKEHLHQSGTKLGH